jgi:hypothetical protein
MPYVELTDLHGKIPPQFLTQALDDDNDGMIDQGIWQLVQGQAEDAVNSRLAQRYTVPVTDPQALPLVRNAALIFACEGVYARRVAPEQNPWMGQANALRAKLDKIGTGDEPLVPTAPKARASGGVIAEPARTFSTRAAI